MTDEMDVDFSADAGAKQDAVSPPQGDSSASIPSSADEFAAAAAAQNDPGGKGTAGAGFKVVNEGDPSEAEAEAAMLAMLNDLPQDQSGAKPEDIDFGTGEVARAEFQQLAQAAATHEPRNIDLLMDVDLPVSIELGRTKLTIADILALGPGSVVELNKLAGEPVDLLVNSKIVARGEVVVVDENFGLRITQLMTPEERLKLLGKE